MAIRSVVDIVKQTLPWLSDGASDVQIGAVRTEMYHYMEKHLGQTGAGDTAVELESNYASLENMMIADMVKYTMGKIRITAVTGGTTAAVPSGKTLKKGKADVAEAEFMLFDTTKGSFQIPTELWLQACLKDVCDKSRELEVANPMCFDPENVNNLTPFIIGCDFPETKVDPYDKILSGGSIG